MKKNRALKYKIKQIQTVKQKKKQNELLFNIKMKINDLNNSPINVIYKFIIIVKYQIYKNV